MSLRSLSDKVILSRIHKLTRCERGVTLRALQASHCDQANGRSPGL